MSKNLRHVLELTALMLVANACCRPRSDRGCWPEKPRTEQPRCHHDQVIIREVPVIVEVPVSKPEYICDTCGGDTYNITADPGSAVVIGNNNSVTVTTTVTTVQNSSNVRVNNDTRVNHAQNNGGTQTVTQEQNQSQNQQQQQQQQQQQNPCDCEDEEWIHISGRINATITTTTGGKSNSTTTTTDPYTYSNSFVITNGRGSR